MDVMSNRTTNVQSSIIPSNTGTGTKIGSFELKTDYSTGIVQEITLVNLDYTFSDTTIDNSTL
jgi:hypothetical protein